MNISEIISRIRRGEDSVTQFKRQAIGVAKLADEMVAFANAEGGVILFGVDDDGTVVGLDDEQKKLVNRDLANAASDGVRPAIYPRTEFHEIDDKLILAVIVSEGVSKPYANKSGEYWTKAGPDKRRVTARDELQRMLQNSLLIHADELPVRKTSAADIDLVHFGKFIRVHFDCELDDLLKRERIGLEQLLNNLGLADGTLLTLAGVMLFGKFPQKNHAQFMVKAVSFVGNDSAGSYYRDSEDITGTIAEMYRGTMSFLKRNLRHVQAGQGFNSLGILEVPEEALQELVVNMFMHRDYFVESPWRVFIFDDRIEIISPGCLPNHLTIEKMKSGVSCARNATIASFASKELPYRGLGTGVKRAVEVIPDIQFESDRDANWLKAIVKRTNTSKDADSKEFDRNQPKSGPKMVSSGPEVAQKWPKSSPETVQKLSTSARQIYEALREEPRMTYRSLASKLGFVKETIRKGIGTLVKEGLVRRVGPKKGGRWEVIG